MRSVNLENNKDQIFILLILHYEGEKCILKQIIIIIIIDNSFPPNCLPIPENTKNPTVL